MSIRKKTGTLAAVLLTLVSANSLHAQDFQGSGGPPVPTLWQTDNAIYVAGLPDVKADSRGSLSLTRESLHFASKDIDGSINVNRITTVSIGDERVATGGSGAKIARMIPVFGFGAAMGAMTNKSEDLLTVEYLDRTGGYHGAVFEVPKTQAAIAQQQLASITTAAPTIAAQPCSGLVTPRTILLAPITFSDINLPAEYRVLLYEQLMNELTLSNGTGTVYRAGDASTPCAAKVLHLSVTAFTKGNEAVRASTGPVGFFVGVTSVKFDVSLVDTFGTVLFRKSLTEKKHGDGNSLNVARDLAKSVSKRLKKAKQSGVQAVS